MREKKNSLFLANPTQPKHSALTHKGDGGLLSLPPSSSRAGISSSSPFLLLPEPMASPYRGETFFLHPPIHPFGGEGGGILFFFFFFHSLSCHSESKKMKGGGRGRREERERMQCANTHTTRHVFSRKFENGKKRNENKNKCY